LDCIGCCTRRICSTSTEMSREELYYCQDCEEEFKILVTVLQINPMCQVCGSLLTPQVAPTVTPNDDTPPIGESRESHESAMHSILELVGADLRDLIMDSMEQARPSRQISVSYLSTLGKVIVESRKVILRDTMLGLGPLRILAVSAVFGYLPPEPSFRLERSIVFGEPAYGELDMLSNANKCKDAIVVLERGKVSFATKCMRAFKAGAAAVVITQSAGTVWPFVMADSANELGIAGVEMNVPVIMISLKDADIVRKWVESSDQRTRAAKDGESRAIDTTTSKLTPSSTGGKVSATGEEANTVMGKDSHMNNATMASVIFSHSVSECSICQEDFEVGATVLKLPCRHCYHADCVTEWLHQNNTCPLCRLELPKEDATTSSGSGSGANVQRRTRRHDGDAEDMPPAENVYFV